MKIESNKNWTTCLRLNTGDGSPRVFLLNSHFLGSVPPQQGFLFQKITLNKDFLSTLKLKEKHYNTMNGSFGINYDVNLPEINAYLSFPASKSIELSFGGSNSNRNYYYSVVVEDKDGYYFRETVSD